MYLAPSAPPSARAVDSPDSKAPPADKSGVSEAVAGHVLTVRLFLSKTVVTRFWTPQQEGWWGPLVTLTLCSQHIRLGHGLQFNKDEMGRWGGGEQGRGELRGHREGGNPENKAWWGESIL